MSAPVPNVALTYFTVTQPSVIDVETNTASGVGPEVTWVRGIVTFTPSLRIISSASLDATVYLDAVVGYFTSDGKGLEMQNGDVGVELVDSVGLGLAAGALTYRVDYQLNQSQLTPPFSIAAPGTGGTVDLNNPAVKIPIID